MNMKIPIIFMTHLMVAMIGFQYGMIYQMHREYEALEDCMQKFSDISKVKRMEEISKFYGMKPVRYSISYNHLSAYYYHKIAECMGKNE